MCKRWHGTYWTFYPLSPSFHQVKFVLNIKDNGRWTSILFHGTGYLYFGFCKFDPSHFHPSDAILLEPTGLINALLGDVWGGWS
jgi:hypothetical protein